MNKPIENETTMPRVEGQSLLAAAKLVAPGSRIYVVALSLVAAIGGFLFGFDSGVVNGTVHALSVAFGTQAAATGFAVASILLGCAVGAFSAGTLANMIGRRFTMLLTATFFLLSAFVSGASGSAAVFIASRILGGAALAVSGATNWVANFAVTVSFLPLLKTIGLSGAYGLYSAAAFVSLLFVWKVVRETKGRTLEEM